MFVFRRVKKFEPCQNRKQTTVSVWIKSAIYLFFIFFDWVENIERTGEMVTSILSFSDDVFIRLVSLCRKKFKQHIQRRYLYILLLHQNPCFPCNITITNFLTLHTCEICLHYDVILQKIPKHGQMCMFWTLIFQFNSLDSVI